MHRNVSNHDERGRKNGQSHNIIPQSTIVEAESAEDGCAWYLDVETVFMVDQGEVFDFIDDEAFEAVMEDRKLCGISTSHTGGWR